MFSRSSWLHLRIPFSYFLLPVYLFSLSVSPNFNEPRLFWVFFILHFLLYPASNGYNSYFDKDEKSIGGLKNPPPVKKGLYFLSLLFDGLAIVLGFIFLNPTFALMLFIYGMVSKMYSHPLIRLKKYPVLGLMTVALFQGLFTFLMCYVGLNNFGLEVALQPKVVIPGLLTTLMLVGNYPITQVYQHEEDAKRGDKTVSMLLGVRGTFYFTMGVFALATIAFIFYFNSYQDSVYAYPYLAFLSPVLLFFGYWFLKVLQNEGNADHSRTMLMNFIAATCLNAFFIYLFLKVSHVMQVF